MENISTELDLTMTRRALELAELGVGRVSPNPLVGCVIVSSDNEIVGEGSYIYENVTHAEVVALELAGERARGGTAYVSLEPHAHHAKTPPCTEALINAGITRVVCPIEDPNPLVSGKGFERLTSAGIEVATGILADEAVRLNEKFICWHRKQRPFVHLKMAMSLDGRISIHNSVSTVLSGEAARERVQDIRHEHDAILVGGNTATVDNPNLTDRSDKPRRRPLVRVVLDNRLNIPLESTLVTTADETPTIVFTNSGDIGKIGDLHKKGVEVIELTTGGRDLAAVLGELMKKDIQSVLVEGGSEIAGAFCDSRLVDKLTFIMAPLIIGGRESPIAIGGKSVSNLNEALRLTDVVTKKLGDDIEITGYPADTP